MLDEGSVYNSQLWEYSLLRLNQLEYFDPLKVDQDSEAHQDPDAGTVDLLLKVKEKGKNSIGMNGGVSGYSGAFLGVNYQTNNFLGLGETLSLQANLGSHQPHLPVRIYPAVYPQPPHQSWLPGLQQQAGLQRCQELPGHDRRVAQPVHRPEVAHAELQRRLRRHQLLRQLSAEAACVPARRRYLFAHQVHHHGLQHGFFDLLPDHRFPLGNSGFESAGRHYQ